MLRFNTYCKRRALVHIRLRRQVKTSSMFTNWFAQNWVVQAIPLLIWVLASAICNDDIVKHYVRIVLLLPTCVLAHIETQGAIWHTICKAMKTPNWQCVALLVACLMSSIVLVDFLDGFRALRGLCACINDRRKDLPGLAKCPISAYDLFLEKGELRSALVIWIHLTMSMRKHLQKVTPQPTLTKTKELYEKFCKDFAVPEVLYPTFSSRISKVRKALYAEGSDATARALDTEFMWKHHRSVRGMPKGRSRRGRSQSRGPTRRN